MEKTVDPGSEARRGRGRPRQIDRRAIVEAGLELGLENLTMRGVAARLGVHPSALNYHVAGRDDLAAAVASAVLELSIGDAWAPPGDAGWRDWVRAFAHELRRILRAHTPLANYFRFPTGPGAAGLEQFDHFLQSLYDAGFGEAAVPLITTYVAQVVFMSVRDELMARDTGVHPQDLELKRKLEQVSSQELVHIRRLLQGGGHRDSDVQFEFDLDCVVAGLEARLPR